MSPTAQPARLRVVVLPPIPWHSSPEARAHQAPDELAIMRRLPDHGVDVTVLNPLGRPWNPFARAHQLLRGIDPLRALSVLLRHRRADALLVLFEGPALLPALLRRATFFRARIAMWELGLTQGWKLREKLQDLAIPRLDAVYVLGANQIAEVRARWPGPEVIALGHCIDTDFWHPIDAPAEDYVLAVGEDEGRDYDILIQATALAGLKLVIRSSRHRAAAGLPMDHVRWLTERCSFATLRDLYARARIVAVPLHERPHAGGVTAVLEGAAMAKPMVVSASSGVLHWAIDGKTCRIVPCADAPAMAAMLRELDDDAEQRQSLAKQAREFVERDCASPVFAARLADHLRALCA